MSIFHVEPPGETVTVEPKEVGKHPPATIIFLHGLGSCGKDQMVFANKFQKRFPYAKILLPSSGKGPVTLNMGLVMPCWHDVHQFAVNESPPQGWKGIAASRAHVNDVLGTELATGIDQSRVIMGGFSQGGAMALLACYTTKYKIGGIFACSGYSPYPDRNEARSTIASSINVHTPVFMGHGTADQVVPYTAGRGTGDVMVAAGTPLQFNVYEKMGHTVNVKEMEDLLNFLATVLEPNGTGGNELLTATAEGKENNAIGSADESKQIEKRSNEISHKSGSDESSLLKTQPPTSAIQLDNCMGVSNHPSTGGNIGK